MTVKVVIRDRMYDLKPGMALRDGLKKLEINPESVLAIRAGQMITDEEILNDGDTVKLIPVISGGCGQ